MRINPTSAIFVVAVAVSMLRHDVYQVGLAASSVILCYWAAACLRKGWARVALFIPCSIALAQMAVIIRRAVLDNGIVQAAKASPVGYVVGDIVHGFRRVILTFVESVEALIRAGGWADYSGLETLNYRYVLVGWLIVILSIVLYAQRPQKRSNDEHTHTAHN